MRGEIEAVSADVLKRITPSEDERVKMEASAARLLRKVSSAMEEFGVKASVEVEGSFAKDTWLKDDPEIDIFMRVSPAIPRESLGDRCLKVARRALEGSEQVERFAEHPYVEAKVDDITVNIVPCYNVKRGEWLSATDRTPFHTDYVKTRLDDAMKNEVRLLKRFMKGIGVYGAEIKIGGFSGYLCELLILHYKSFVAALQAFADYKDGIILDIENHFRERKRELTLRFREHLVIIDPVDERRNTASAVQTPKLYTVIAAARAFLKKPASLFFYPPKTIAFLQKRWNGHLKNADLPQSLSPSEMLMLSRIFCGDNCTSLNVLSRNLSA